MTTTRPAQTTVDSRSGSSSASAGISTQASPGVSAHWSHGLENLPREHGFEPLRVEGRLPADLHGTLLRNGPMQMERFGLRYDHWFDGDGGVAAVRFAGGQAEGAVRLVQSHGLLEERARGRALHGGYGTLAPLPWWKRVGAVFRPMKNAANTSLMLWNGELLALWEGGRPTRLSLEDLATLGETSFDRAINRTFSAHPHRVADRRATYNFGVRMGRVTELDIFEMPDGGPVRKLTSIPLAGSTMIHDFIATQRHLIFYAPPLRLNLPKLMLGIASYSDSLVWKPEEGTEVIVVPLETPDQPVRFTVEPFYQWHFGNAFERGEKLVVDLVRHPDFGTNQYLKELGTGHISTATQGRLYRTELDLKAKTMKAEKRIETVCEFPRVAPWVEGRPYRLAWLAAHGSDAAARGPVDALLKVDMEGGQGTVVSLGGGQYPSEPVFVPRPGATAEDDGYLLSLIYDAHTHRSYVAVLDARAIDAEPLARVWFDHHIPLTFHGIWAPGASA